MATSSNRLNLTRDQLASFLKDHEQIRQFEKLFATVDTIAPDVVVEVSTAAGSAQATAVQALGLVAAVAQEASVAVATAEARATEALQQVAALAQEAQTCCAVNEAKAIEALDRISMLAQEMQTQAAVADNKATQALQLVTALAPIVEGLQMLPPPREFKRARYGQFYDTTIQTAAAINTAYAVTFNTTDVSSGVYLGTPSSRVTVDTEGVYNFLFSIQLDKTAGGVGLFWVWPRINGVDVPDSNSQIRIQGNNAEQLVTVGYFFELKANDYVEIMFAVDDTTVQLESFPASAFYPSIPSIILTVSNNIKGVQ